MKKRKRKINSTDKGRRGEWAVRDYMRWWWAGVEPNALFERTPRSGALIYGAEYGMAGDIMTTAKFFPFAIEVKFKEGWVPSRLLKCQRSPVWAWWAQCLRDARKLDREPMLWAKKSHMPWYVLLREEYVERCGIVTGFVDYPYRLIEETLARKRIDFGELPVVFKGDEFLELNPEVFVRGLTGSLG